MANAGAAVLETRVALCSEPLGHLAGQPRDANFVLWLPDYQYGAVRVSGVATTVRLNIAS